MYDVSSTGSKLGVRILRQPLPHQQSLGDITYNADGSELRLKTRNVRALQLDQRLDCTQALEVSCCTACGHVRVLTCSCAQRIRIDDTDVTVSTLPAVFCWTTTKQWHACSQTLGHAVAYHVAEQPFVIYPTSTGGRHGVALQ